MDRVGSVSTSGDKAGSLFNNYSQDLKRKNKHLEKIVQDRNDKLSKSEKKYRSLVDLSPLSILTVNSTGRVTFVNKEFKEKFGFDINNRLESLLSLFMTDKRPEIEGYLQAHNKVNFKEKLWLMKCYGEKAWCQITISQISDVKSTESNHLVLIDDISELKLQEQIEREKQIAEEASSAKTEFLTNISHEIRTPLSAISGFIDLIIKKNTNFEISQCLNTVKRNSQHLLILVNDLLDLSKIESGQLDINLTSFSLVDEVESIVEMLKPLVLNRPIDIRIAYEGLVPRQITSDTAKFRQILINLINNSIKYTNEGFIEILMRVEFDEKSNLALLRANVRDTGHGISDMQKERLFVPFCRGKGGEVLGRDGVGIGLALSRKLAISLGGDICLSTSTVGQGSEFEVVLPVGEYKKMALYQPKSLSLKERPIFDDLNEESSDLLKEKKILVVEDAEDIRTLVTFILVSYGAEVVCCENGLEALSTLNDDTFDLVLMDIQMPVKDGLETVRELREVKRYRGKILALTAHAFKTERDRCFAAGFDGFITKPFSEAQLLSSIGAALEGDYSAPRKVSSAVKKEVVEIENSIFFDESMRPAIGLFCKNLKVNIQNLKSFTSKRNWTKTKALAHQIKGSAACFGYNEMSSLAARLEVLAGSSNPENSLEFQVIFSNMENDLNKIKENLKVI